MTDPISAMLIMIKNASNAGKKSVTVPYSKVKDAIAKCLLAEGYVSSVEKGATAKGFSTLVIGIAYDAEKKPKVRTVKRVSKPSRRMYTGFKKLYPGNGIMVLSTPKGIMTSREAKKQVVGGEVLFVMQ